MAIFMNIFITGISGLIGQALTQTFLAKGHSVFGLTRNIARTQQILGDTVTLYATLPADFDHKLDIVINLQGEGIADKPWSAKRKKQLYVSRVTFTEELIHWINARAYKPTHFINASAVGFYGSHKSHIVDELTPPNDEFTHQLCKAWEQAAINTNPCDHISIMRLGVVLSEQGGFLSKLKLPFKCGLSAKLGDGTQYLSWIHLDDVVNAIHFLYENNLQGTFNFTAPSPVTNSEFTKAYGKALKRPTFLCAPAFILKAGLGEMSDLLLKGQRVVPNNLHNAGYSFSYSDIQSALEATN